MAFMPQLREKQIIVFVKTAAGRWILRRSVRRIKNIDPAVVRTRHGIRLPRRWPE